MTQTHVTFISGDKDGLVTPKRISQYMGLYGSEVHSHIEFEKHLLKSKSSHVEQREDHVIHQAEQFTKKCLENEKYAIKRVEAKLWDMKRYKRIKSIIMTEDVPNKNMGVYSTDPYAEHSRQPFSQYEQRVGQTGGRRPAGTENTIKRANTGTFEPVGLKKRTDKDIFGDYENPNQQSTQSSDETKQQPRAQNPGQFTPAGKMKLRLVETKNEKRPVAQIFDDPQTGNYQTPIQTNFNDNYKRGNNNYNDYQYNINNNDYHYDNNNYYQTYEPIENRHNNQINRSNSTPDNAHYGYNPQQAHQYDGVYNNHQRYEQRASRRDELMEKFDDEDLSLLLDERFQHADTNIVVGGGVQQLDESMAMDLLALNKLLKAKPHHK